jgi:outer membrane protein assembly factor BamE (lipoprotein component of BamABCDE complex)
MRRWLGVAMLSALVLACTGPRLTQANVDQVSEGMSRKQVESILGPPTTMETKEFLLLKRTTYFYRQSNGTVTVLFKDDKVEAKSSTLPK